MLPKVTQSSAWKQKSYVCLGCRRQHRLDAYEWQQLRHNAHLVQISQSNTGDEWFDNLNEISDTYGTSKLAPAPSQSKPHKLNRATKTNEHSPVASRSENEREYLRVVRKTRVRGQEERAKKSANRERIRKEAQRDAHRKSSVYTHASDSKLRKISTGSQVDTISTTQTSSSKSLSQFFSELNQDLAVNNAVNESPYAKYRAKISPAARGLGGPVSNLDNLRSSFFLGTESQQASQKPYGIRDASRTTPRGASFSSLRHADRVSLERPVSSAVAATPFGIAAPRDAGHGNNSPASPFHYASSASEQAALAATEAQFGQVSGSPKVEDSLQVGETIDSVPAHLSSPQNAQKPSPHPPRKARTKAPETAAEAVMKAILKERKLSVASGKPDVHSISNKNALTTTEELPSDLKSVLPAEQSQRSELAEQYGIERSSGTGLQVATASATPASWARSLNSGSAASGGDGSGEPPDDSESTSIAGAMTKPRKQTRKARTMRERRTSVKASKARSASEPIHPPEEEQQMTLEASESSVVSISPAELLIEPVDIAQPNVPFLAYDLDRVLFNPGVYQLQDPKSRVYNFDPYLQHIMPVTEFDFNSLKEYKTSSQDTALSNLAEEHGKRYIGSTSSMTSSLTHFHYLLSNWRPINLGMLSHDFVSTSTKTNMTEINRAPSAIFLRWKNGTYAIDADKEFDGANVLMLLGKSMELLLTLPKSHFERYRKSDPRQVPEEQKTAPESYQYTTMRDFLMRSQLDAYDPRLPGNGTFDLKTRAVVSVRMQAKEFEPMTGYEIFSLHGKWNSYEREYYDMMRSTMLKYMLQARMGRMDGIFVAYHNVKRIFGFQYIPMHELDRALHGQVDACLGDQEFRASLDMLNEVLNKATTKFPQQSLRLHFETQEPGKNGVPAAMHVFAEPMSEEDIDRIQNSGKAKIAAFERDIMGKDTETAVDGADSAAEAQHEHFTTDGREHEREHRTASSDSDADVEFLQSIEDSSNEELKPLFYATIIIQSKVNGEIPNEDRPENLGRDDKWEIDYILKEYKIGRSQWALYEDMKARRKYKFAEAREDEDEGDPESEGQDKRMDGYIQMLRSLSDRSRETRIRLDQMDAEKEQVWVGEGLPHDREEINDVEDYTNWLYKVKDT